jgi:hypothetical protein
MIPDIVAVPNLDNFVQKLKFCYFVEKIIAEKNERTAIHLKKWEKLSPHLQ